MLPAVLAVVVLLGLIGGMAYLTIKTTMTAKTEEAPLAEQQQQQQQEVRVVRRPAPGGGRQDALARLNEGMRRRLAQRQAEAAAGQAGARNEDSDADAASGSGSDDDAEMGALQQRGGVPGAGVGDRQSKRSAYEERRAKREAEREAQEAAQEEEMRRAAEERARREEAEAAKWMSQISVEEQGEDGDESGAAAEGLLAQFVEYIVARKTVPLEALAVEFGVRTADAIDRIRGLEAMGRLTGVMDERGKYIYISLDEMKAVASYIRSRGRVAIGELAARSASLIDLEARPEGPGAAGDKGGAALDFDQLLAAA